MPEYTVKDVIIDPEDPRLEDAIGKLVYMGNIPQDLVYQANRGGVSLILTNIISSYDMPFFSNEYCFPCIILKKEDPKLEYTSFESLEEFIDTYEIQNKSLPKLETTISSHGMWLKKNKKFILRF